MPSREPSDRDQTADSVDTFLRLVASQSNPFDFAATALKPGSLLADRFQVEVFVRRGGMGAIYRGIDRETDAHVAIKTIGPLTADAGARFVRETRILAELSHPRIVRYLAHGTTPGGVMYLAMEWLTGEDLAERLARMPLTIQESCVLLRGISEALAVAHARGIVHRDIKPANLFLLDSDPASVKLLDFGVARVVETDNALTTGGARIGTIGYMSPEQARGDRDVDARADVFALGCVFYECLTGKAPFTSAHAVGVLAKVLQEDPKRPSELRTELDPRFDDFISTLLAKNPKDRPKDAAAALSGLHELLTVRRGPLPPRRSLSVRGSEQRIISVILGRKAPSKRGEAATVDMWLQELARKYSARVAPLKGGALLLVLTGKGEANDRAAQAALCALELSQRRPDLRLAVATGLAETSGNVPVGAAIDTGAALLAASNRSGVLLDDVTLGLVGSRFEIRREADVSILLGARNDFDPPRVLMGRPTPCVGRDGELRTLDEALDACVLDRVSRAVIVSGPPGIGKSRLAREWIQRGGHAGAIRTLFARLDPTSAGSAWSLVQRLIRDAAGLRESETRDRQIAKVNEYLSGLLDAEHAARAGEFICEIICLRATKGKQSKQFLAARGNPEVMHEQARRALHTWLGAEMARQPMLLVVEDLHWGDIPSVGFLAEVLREKPHSPLMVLAMARPEVERQFPELCRRAQLRLRLPGLGERATTQLAEAVLPERPDGNTVERLVRLTEGNPFYLEELIRCLAVGRMDWPQTVMAMAQSRIDRLDSSTRCVLRAASVFGERCWDGGIAEIVEGLVDVDEVLKCLVREEILLEVPEARYAGSREYRFRHALLRDAAYEMLTEEDRCTAHGIAGGWLERNGEKNARLLADHYEAAKAHERASPWLLRAAKKTINAGDLLGTIELANRGATLATSGVDHGRFLLLRSYAEALQGQPDMRITREALDLLPTGTPPWWLALGILIFAAGMRGKPEEAAPYIALAREAPFTRESDMPLGQGLVTLVGGLVLLGKPSVAEVILERARASETLGELDPDPVFRAFLTAAECALAAVAPVGGRWQLERALQEGRHCAEVLGSLGAIYGQSVVLMYLAIAAMHLGRHDEARDACLRSCDLARQASTVIRDAWPALFLARAYLHLHQPHEALKAVEPVRSASDQTARQLLPIVLGEVQLQLGNNDTAEAEVESACRGSSPRLQRLAACVLVRARLNRGRTREALSVLEHTMQFEGAAGLESEIDLMNLRVECLLACGQREAASRVAVRTKELVVKLSTDIRDEDLRASFLARVEPCARALALYEALS
jgi:tetratricopeptide (TPR) repeat protein